MSKIVPRYYQIESCNAMFDYFHENTGHPLIELPTASGKSLVQVMIAERMLSEYPECRMLFLTHSQELIKQNYNEMITQLGMVDAGIYSAGLNCRDTDNKIIFAGIQSVYKKHLELGCFNLIIVDECHLISKKGEGMYRTFLKNMFIQAPYCKIVGLTATPYRLDSGLLTEGEGHIFDDIIYRAEIGRLIKEGYICKLIGKAGIIKPDVSGVHKRGGEYIESELAEVCDNDIIIEKAVAEITELTKERKHILIFCVGIQHAEHVAQKMRDYNINCKTVHSKIPDTERDKIISEFKDGEIRAIANVDMLTTGFNYKNIDCIVMLRPTESTGLYYQCVGRGFRIHPDKADCLVLDYAGNILRHGPVDKIEVTTKGFKRGVSTAPMKECPECKQPVPLATLKCECGYEWPINEGDRKLHGSEADNVEPISKYRPPEEYVIDPDDVHYYSHLSKSGQMCMRVSYYLDLMVHYDTFVCIEHEGYARQKAVQWLRNVLPPDYPVPDTVEEALQLADVYKKPTSIFIDFNQKYPRIISQVYADEDIEQNEVEENIRKVFIW